jgi:subtilisin family serine protease
MLLRNTARRTQKTDSIASQTDSNPYGHGTHVAGLAAGNKYGIAPKASIINVKVLGEGSEGGSISGITQG